MVNQSMALVGDCRLGASRNVYEIVVFVLLLLVLTTVAMGSMVMVKPQGDVAVMRAELSVHSLPDKGSLCGCDMTTTAMR